MSSKKGKTEVFTHLRLLEQSNRYHNFAEACNISLDLGPLYYAK